MLNTKELRDQVALLRSKKLPIEYNFIANAIMVLDCADIGLISPIEANVKANEQYSLWLKYLAHCEAVSFDKSLIHPTYEFVKLVA